MSAHKRPVVALTIGDPNGIGPEIAVKAAIALAQEQGPIPLLIGDPFVVSPWIARCAGDLKLIETAGDDFAEGPAIHLLPIDALPLASYRPGEIDAAAGAATIAYVDAAIRLFRAGSVQAIVGCPHSETAIHAAGIAFSGYPSLLARRAGLPEDRVFLMLIGGGLRIIHATLHERLQTALARLSPDLLEAAARAAIGALRRLGIAHPRLGICAINPHAGEAGLFGDDDSRITAPAVQRLVAEGLAVEGPTGADLLLGRSGFDGFVAIYHDQGHVPVKLLAGREAIALSVGGDIVFASTGHGSAHDIAGKGIADPAGVLRALRLMSNLGHSGG